MKMKMIIAIVNSDDANTVSNNLIKNGFQITKLSTQGGFLKAGTTTFLIGVAEEKVQEAIDIIREYSKSRKQIIPTSAEMGINFFPAMPVEVMVGGATIFVVDVDRFEKA